jgi:PAS domain-containing protein
MTDPLKPDTQYQILFDSNPQPMWVYEAKTLRFLAVNEATVRHYGYSRSVRAKQASERR